MARRLGLIGLAGFVLIVVAGLLEPRWDVPGSDASGSEVASYVAANRDGFIGALLVYTVAMSLFLAFSAGLWAWLVRRGACTTVAAAFLAGAVALVAVVFAGFATFLALAYRSPDVSPDTAILLYDLCFGLLAVSGAPTAVALGAFFILVVRDRLMPRVTGWVAGIAAVAHVVILFSFVPRTGFFSLEGGVIVAVPATMFLWLLVTSAALLRAE